MTIEEYYLIKIDRSSYYAHVSHPFPTLDKVHIGGKKRCVCFSIYLDGDDPNLDAIGYDVNCNVTGDMTRGSGTKHMIMASFAFLRSRYPTTSHKVVLRDKSKITCRRGEMYLSAFYVLHYGQTWYQRHFGAYPYEESLVAPLQAAADELHRYKRTKPDAGDLFGDVKGSRRQTVLFDLYREERSFGSFLRAIKDMDCDVYAQWAERFIYRRMPFLLGMEWYIDTDRLTIPLVDVIPHGSERPRDMFVMSS